jgi:hypothetical protein
MDRDRIGDVKQESQNGSEHHATETIARANQRNCALKARGYGSSYRKRRDVTGVSHVVL